MILGKTHIFKVVHDVKSLRTTELGNPIVDKKKKAIYQRQFQSVILLIQGFSNSDLQRYKLLKSWREGSIL